MSCWVNCRRTSCQIDSDRSCDVTVQVSDTVQVLAEHGEVPASGVLAAPKPPSP
jgi:hypothetical protein